MVKRMLLGLLLIILIGCANIAITEDTLNQTTQQMMTSEDTLQTTQQMTTSGDNLLTTTESVTEMTTNQEIPKLKQTATLDAEMLFLYQESFDNLVFDQGVIKLQDSSSDGIYISKALPINDFFALVMSWNALIDEASRMTFSIAIGHDGLFSDFYIMGYWTQDYKSSFPHQDDDSATINIDTLIPKIAVSSIKIKCLIRASETNETALRNISITTKPSERNMVIDHDLLGASNIIVPKRAQLSIPDIGRRICSPTSLSMLLAYYDYPEAPEIVAEHVYDQGASIYGNWSLNASYAGGFNDLYARVEYIDDFSLVVDYLRLGIPMALSIKTSHLTDLDGSIMAYPNGHLIVLRGLEMIDGLWYGIVNDPAAYEAEDVERRYLLDELIAAWTGYTYVVQSMPFS